MGTGRPPVTVRAATLAGGENNQDRYAYGDAWAFVLDGASSFATIQPEHDGEWYAERLKNALVHELTRNPSAATSEIVARAIEIAASAHDDPETCPTSTIAMARWTAETIETYVLGDSTAVLIGTDGEEEITDSRLAGIAPHIRAGYRSRLAGGHGFDERHKELLARLQSAQAEARNRDGGYWIAGAAPEAALLGLRRAQSLLGIDAVILATDGAAKGVTFGIAPTWRDAVASNLATFLRATRAAEAVDSRGTTWPRSKRHDDKSILCIAFQAL